jgi:hypothetical protein
MTQRIHGPTILCGLLLGLGLACNSRPQVTTPDKVYELPGEPVSAGSRGRTPAAAPQEKTTAPSPATPATTVPPEKKQ